MVHIVGEAKRSVLERAEQNPDPLRHPVSAFLGARVLTAGGRHGWRGPSTGEKGIAPKVLTGLGPLRQRARFCFSIVRPW